MEEKVSDFEIINECNKHCQFWEVNDCMDFREYKKLILTIENIINLPGESVTDGECINLITAELIKFKKDL